MSREPASHSLSSSVFPPWKKASRGVRPASKPCFLHLLVSRNRRYQVVSRPTAFSVNTRPAMYASKLLGRPNFPLIPRHSKENHMQDGARLRRMHASGNDFA